MSFNAFFSVQCPFHIGFVGEGVGFADREYLVWYILFVIFVPYAMLPLPLKWCVITGTISASCHLTVITIIKFQRRKNGVSCCLTVTGSLRFFFSPRNLKLKTSTIKKCQLIVETTSRKAINI